MAPGVENSRLQRSMEVTIDASIDIPSCTRCLIQASNTIRDVRVKIHESYDIEQQQNAEEESKHLFRSIGNLPKLKSLSFDAVSSTETATTSSSSSDHHYCCRLPLHVLTNVVSHAHQLKDLFLTNVILIIGSHQEMETFVTVLQETQHKLEEFGLLHCKLLCNYQDQEEDGIITSTSPIDQLFQAISQLPKLSVFHFHATRLNALGTLHQSTSLLALCQSDTSSLVEMKLHNFDWTDDQVMTVARTLENNDTMQELAIDGCNMTLMTTSTFCKMIRHNSSLKWLELGVKHQQQQQRMEERFIIQFADALEENTTLKHFALEGEGGGSGGDTTLVAAAPGVVHTLSQVCKEAYVRMLEENCVLTSLRVFSILGEETPEFNMYLTLNKYGRNRLLQGGASRHDWLEAMCKMNTSLDCLYYCLITNPFLCHITKETQALVRLVVKRRGHKRRRLNPRHGEKTSPPERSSNSMNGSSYSSSSLSSSTHHEVGHTTTSSSSDPKPDQKMPARNGRFATHSSYERLPLFSCRCSPLLISCSHSMLSRSQYRIPYIDADLKSRNSETNPKASRAWPGF